MRSRDKSSLRKKVGTVEWVIDRWTKKLWLAYPVYAFKGDFILPSFLRKEFERDIRMVLEYMIKEIAPEKSLLGRTR